MCADELAGTFCLTTPLTCGIGSNSALTSTFTVWQRWHAVVSFDRLAD
jgi:hypothetical protein